MIGAGPAGLAVAACLGREGIRARLVDAAGEPGGAYRRLYPGMTLSSPARYNGLPGLRLSRRGEYTPAAAYHDYLRAYARFHALEVERACVERVDRDGAAFRVAFAGDVASASARVVVVATGMFDHPVLPVIDGLGPSAPAASDGPQVLHSSEWRGPGRLGGERLLVIGGATSAIEIAEEAARAGKRVVVSARSGVKAWPRRVFGRDLHDWFRPFETVWPVQLARRYCWNLPALPGTDLGFRALRGQGRIRVTGGMARFEGRCAIGHDGERIEVDAVVCATGYRFATGFLPPEMLRSPAGAPAVRRGESVSWPGLYLVGFPCARTLASEFLRGIATDAQYVARRIRLSIG